MASTDQFTSAQLPRVDTANGDIQSPITGTKFTHSQTEYQVFPEEFFSGADVTIYFGDVFVDTITGLEFTLQEQLRPINGYADYTWSDIARGSRMVQGTFRIAFKEAGHLFVILDHLAQLGAQAQPALGYLMTNQTVPLWHANARQTIEDTLGYYHGDSGRKVNKTKQITKKEIKMFDWPTMRIGSTDSNSPSQMAKIAGYPGAVSHLQALLINHGFKITGGAARGWDTSHLVGLHQRYWDGEHWEPYSVSGHNGEHDSSYFYGVNGDWPQYGRPSQPIRQDYVDENEKILERLLYSFNFLKDNNVRMSDHGDGTDVDGKFGDLVRRGVALFQMFAEYAPSSSEPSGYEAEYLKSAPAGHTNLGWGGWVDSMTASLLARSTNVNGVYDVTTKAAVYDFQKKYRGTFTGLDGHPYSISVTGNCDTATVMKMAMLWNAFDVKQTVSDGVQEVAQAGTATDLPSTYMNRVKQYEREIWGRNMTQDRHNRRTFFYDGGSYTSGNTNWLSHLKKTGFDLYITYGPIGVWALQNQNPNDPSTYPGAFPKGATTAPFPNTVHAIRNVQLANIGQVLGADGNPIEETYGFVAQDID